jgi:arsenate reductase-like glutaredoxin family protein
MIQANSNTTYFLKSCSKIKQSLDWLKVQKLKVKKIKTSEDWWMDNLC